MTYIHVRDDTNGDGQEAAKDKESLQSHGVTHILTVNGKEPAFKDAFEYK